MDMLLLSVYGLLFLTVVAIYYRKKFPRYTIKKTVYESGGKEYTVRNWGFNELVGEFPSLEQAEEWIKEELGYRVSHIEIIKYETGKKKETVSEIERRVKEELLKELKDKDLLKDE